MATSNPLANLIDCAYPARVAAVVEKVAANDVTLQGALAAREQLSTASWDALFATCGKVTIAHDLCARPLDVERIERMLGAEFRTAPLGALIYHNELSDEQIGWVCSLDNKVTALGLVCAPWMTFERAQRLVESLAGMAFGEDETPPGIDATLAFYTQWRDHFRDDEIRDALIQVLGRCRGVTVSTVNATRMLSVLFDERPGVLTPELVEVDYIPLWRAGAMSLNLPSECAQWFVTELKHVYDAPDGTIGAVKRSEFIAAVAPLVGSPSLDQKQLGRLGGLVKRIKSDGFLPRSPEHQLVASHDERTLRFAHRARAEDQESMPVDWRWRWATGIERGRRTVLVGSLERMLADEVQPDVDTAEAALHALKCMDHHTRIVFGPERLDAVIAQLEYLDEGVAAAEGPYIDRNISKELATRLSEWNFAFLGKAKTQRLAEHLTGVIGEDQGGWEALFSFAANFDGTLADLIELARVVGATDTVETT